MYPLDVWPYIPGYDPSQSANDVDGLPKLIANAASAIALELVSDVHDAVGDEIYGLIETHLPCGQRGLAIATFDEYHAFVVRALSDLSEPLAMEGLYNVFHMICNNRLTPVLGGRLLSLSSLHEQLDAASLHIATAANARVSLYTLELGGTIEEALRSALSSSNLERRCDWHALVEPYLSSLTTPLRLCIPQLIDKWWTY